MKNRNQPVAIEGYPFIGFFAFLTLLCAALDWGFLAFVGFCLTLFTVYFFRNPERYPPGDESDVVAPADGRVIFVGTVPEDRCTPGRDAIKISIFMNVFNVHVNRVPVSGRVVDLFYNRGRFFNASLDKASLENEQAGLLVETTGGARILFVQIAGLVARRIVSYPEIGDQLQRGKRYGLIRFGSRVDIYLPVETEIKVRLGDRTVAGETVLGGLP
ncbi:MAG: phosphatidylserine decarboxylase family protein [Desulfuromonadales bacterium]|nr:phosphatidylserine decarboxylase family protein [Desulfuromonadales bacterium]